MLRNVRAGTLTMSMKNAVEHVPWLRLIYTDTFGFVSSTGVVVKWSKSKDSQYAFWLNFRHEHTCSSFKMAITVKQEEKHSGFVID